MGFWTCNIDRRGRWIRLGSGVLALVAAAGLARAGWTLPAIAAGLLGALGLFQAARGWCLARALGFRTRW